MDLPDERPGDPRFFARSGPHAVQLVAATAAAAPVVAELMLSGVAPLQVAGPAEVSFLDNRRYADALRTSRAGAVLVHPDLAGLVPAGCIALVTREPYLGWARVAALFHPPPPIRPGTHPTALVDAAASVDPSVEVGPFAVIEAGAEVGARSRIGAGAVVGQGVRIGADCRIGTHASISHALIGERVTIFPGARIGQDGFGFAATATGFVTVPQLGRVLIGDDAEIGANTTIDRGSGHDTVIGAGSRLDNLVQIGHNVRLGRCCVVVAQAGISGSTVLGDFVQIGGQAGLTGHLAVGSYARIGAQAGVMSDVAARSEVAGAPAQPVRDLFREVAWLRRAVRQGRGGASGGKAGKADPDAE